MGSGKYELRKRSFWENVVLRLTAIWRFDWKHLAAILAVIVAVTGFLVWPKSVPQTIHEKANAATDYQGGSNKSNRPDPPGNLNQVVHTASKPVIAPKKLGLSNADLAMALSETPPALRQEFANEKWSGSEVTWTEFYQGIEEVDGVDHMRFGFGQTHNDVPADFYAVYDNKSAIMKSASSGTYVVTGVIDHFTKKGCAVLRDISFERHKPN